MFPNNVYKDKTYQSTYGCAWEFLPRVTTSVLTRLTPDIDIGILSVRPSVRDVQVLYRNGLTHRHSFFTTR